LIHLIQGVWFQKREGLGLAFDGTGAVPVWQAAMCRFMFAGGFGPADGNPRVLAGNMTDPAGESELADIRLTGTTLSFVKKYIHRRDLIQYTFRKGKNGTWDGEYSGSACGTGKSRCVLTQIPDEFLAIDTSYPF
jgi:hypothetical protein